MKRGIIIPLLVLNASAVFAQEATPTAVAEPNGSASPIVTASPVDSTGMPDQPKPKRGWFGRVLHPFSGGEAAPVPQVSNPKLRGLVLELQVSPQTVKLSEVRQVELKVTLSNRGKKAVTLDFPNEQRIEIVLLNAAEVPLARWSDNHAFKEKAGTLLINPQEHVEYNEKITTRELTPDKVFTAEAYFPKYPELRARQKFLTEP
jgi:hypothetical protein